MANVSEKTIYNKNAEACSMAICERESGKLGVCSSPVGVRRRDTFRSILLPCSADIGISNFGKLKLMQYEKWTLRKTAVALHS